jgi:hypothetical protein
VPLIKDEEAKVVGRVEKLLRLAGNNANEEEARTAAVQAARLIREHGLVVRRREQPQHEPVRAAAAPKPARVFQLGPWILGAIFVWWLVNQIHC